MADVCKPITDAQAIVNAYDIPSQSLKVSEVNSLLNFAYDNFTVDRSIAKVETYKFYLGNVLAGTIELTYLEDGRTTLVSGRKY